MRTRLDTIVGLNREPRPAGVKKLTGRGDWRIRIGQYRIVYEIDDEQLVTVYRVAHRSDVYRG